MLKCCREKDRIRCCDNAGQQSVTLSIALDAISGLKNKLYSSSRIQRVGTWWQHRKLEKRIQYAALFAADSLPVQRKKRFDNVQVVTSKEEYAPVSTHLLSILIQCWRAIGLKLKCFPNITMCLGIRKQCMTSTISERAAMHLRVVYVVLLVQATGALATECSIPLKGGMQD